MPVTQDKSGPYAPAPAIIGLVERFRDRGLPVPITAEVLARAGVSESLVPRTLYALQVLDLIDEAGNPTPIFEAIRKAPEAEYKDRMGEWLSSAYGDILAYVDPATADETALHDAFRSYMPAGQRARMVTLFMGLFRAAGIMPEKATSGGPRKKVATTRVTPRRRADATKPKSAGGTGASGGSGGTKPSDFGGELPPAIAGLLASLPTHGEGWTKPEREAFMHAFGVVVDFVFPPGVVKSKKVEGDDASDT